MRGRLVAVGVGLASMVALGASSIMPGCYSAPEPACGFLCGANPPCPEDYQQLMVPSVDGTSQVCRCVLPGTTAAMCALSDAGVFDAPVPLDAAPDGFLPDVSPPPDVAVDAPVDAEIPDGMVDAVVPDAMVDAAVPDAELDAAVVPDAMIDAAIVPDAPPDAPPDAATDAATDAAIAPDAADDAAVPTD